MPFDIKGIRTIITYYQEDEPSSPQIGDVWYNPRTDHTLVRGPLGWFLLPRRLVNDYAWYMPVTETTKDQVFRLTFPFDSGSMVRCGKLTAPDMYAQAGTNSSIFGYLFGYREASATGTVVHSNIQRFRFPFDFGQTEIISAVMPYGDTHECPACCSSAHGFVTGGYYGGVSHSTIQRLNFATVGTDVATGTLTAQTTAASAVNSSLLGYVCAGGTSVISGHFSYVQRFAFPADTAAVTSSYVTQERQSGCSANSSTHGYVLGFGGDAADFESVYSVANRFAFPFDTGTAEAAGTLADAVADAMYCSTNSTVAGYVVSGDGGTGVGYRSTIQRCVFPFDAGTVSELVGFAPFAAQAFPGIDGTDFVRQFVSDTSGGGGV